MALATSMYKKYTFLWCDLCVCWKIRADDMLRRILLKRADFKTSTDDKLYIYDGEYNQTLSWKYSVNISHITHYKYHLNIYDMWLNVVFLCIRYIILAFQLRFPGTDKISPLVTEWQGSLSRNYILTSSGATLYLLFTSNMVQENRGFSVEVYTTTGTCVYEYDSYGRLSLFWWYNNNTIHDFFFDKWNTWTTKNSWKSEHSSDFLFHRGWTV